MVGGGWVGESGGAGGWRGNRVARVAVAWERDARVTESQFADWDLRVCTFVHMEFPRIPVGGAGIGWEWAESQESGVRAPPLFDEIGTEMHNN